MVKYILMLNVNVWTVQEFREQHIQQRPLKFIWISMSAFLSSITLGIQLNITHTMTNKSIKSVKGFSEWSWEKCSPFKICLRLVPLRYAREHVQKELFLLSLRFYCWAWHHMVEHQSAVSVIPSQPLAHPEPPGSVFLCVGRQKAMTPCKHSSATA